VHVAFDGNDADEADGDEDKCEHDDGKEDEEDEGEVDCEMTEDPTFLMLFGVLGVVVLDDGKQQIDHHTRQQ
jgi:hypothetical protein